MLPFRIIFLSSGPSSFCVLISNYWAAHLFPTGSLEYPPLGRAIYIIQQTLPDFFDHGLITTSSDNGNGKRKGQTVSTSSSSLYSDPSVTQKAEDFEEEPESIYSPKIRLAYTPPVRLPSPFPATLHVEGTFSSLFITS